MSDEIKNFYNFDKIRFYYQARGSIGEVQNFLILAKDLKFISNEKYTELEKKGK